MTVRPVLNFGFRGSYRRKPCSCLADSVSCTVFVFTHFKKERPVPVLLLVRPAMCVRTILAIVRPPRNLCSSFCEGTTFSVSAESALRIEPVSTPVKSSFLGKEPTQIICRNR
ncbi:hypothetical protein AVEN_236335-1 [Araneus ventricosus]|uniref:Uncharacterized protein n=1 Tax=Araneus ventricosus TaxID=182803 RepID=A0A4Y2QVZ3_ARAVE|nr:hypothetical protein AVEN_236335-1 [Araneus ventricosus]